MLERLGRARGRAASTAGPKDEPDDVAAVLRLTCYAMFTYEAMRPLYAVVSSVGVAHTSPTRLAAVAFAFVYMSVGAAMVRSGRTFTALRLVLVVAEALLVTSAADAGHTRYIPGSVVLACELGLRVGPAGFVVAASVGGAAAVSSPAASDAILAPLPILVFATLMGWGFRTYLRLRGRTLDRRCARELSARSYTAQVAGRTDVLLGSGDAADLLQRAAVLVELEAPNGASDTRREIAAAKLDAAETSRDRGRFLTDTLLGWSSRRNSSPDLTRHIGFDIPRDLGVMLLTGAQDEALTNALDHVLPPTGQQRSAVPVRLRSGDASRPDRPRVLAIGDFDVAIPAEKSHASWVLSPIPAMSAMLTLWMVAPWLIGDISSPLVPCAFACAGVALTWAVRNLIERSDRNVPIAVWSMIAVAAAYGTAVRPYVATEAGESILHVPSSGSIEMIVITLVFSWTYLSARSRVLAVFAVFGLVASVGLHASHPRELRDYVAETAGVWMSLPLLGVVDDHFQRLADQRRRWFESSSQNEVDIAFLASRAETVAQLRDYADAVDADIVAGGKIGSRVLAEARRRVAQARQQLDIAEIRDAMSSDHPG